MHTTPTVPLNRTLPEGSIYTMCIRNVARHLRNLSDSEREVHGFDAFSASQILAVAFAKLPEDVLADIVTIKL